MSAPAIVRGRPWRRLTATTTRKRLEVIALALAVVGCGVVGLEAAATADPDKVKGTTVPDADVAAVVEAALSCPALTPPKVAAQIMAASAFTGSATRIAGLDTEDWGRWRPSPDAVRGDRRANIVALGHRTCELVGRLRAAKLDGDLWPAAIAAERTGLDAVLDAHGIPKDVKSYVDKVKGYAAWYAAQPQFSEKTGAQPADAKAAEELKVPDALVPPIQAAGRICPAVTPSRIAAQLRAMSEFDVNLRTSERQGVAQFTPEMWEQYRPGTGTSVWRPADAIPALAIAMCDMTNQLSELSGEDPFRLALGAYQWGIDAVRRAGGLPEANVEQLADRVSAHLAEYEKDDRLSAPAPKPGATRQTGKPATAKPSPSSSSAAEEPSKTDEQKPKEPTLFAYDPDAKYQIQNAWAKAIVELPGINENTRPGSRVHLWENENYEDQFWRLRAAPDKRHVIIANVWNDMALAVEDRSLQENAKMAVYDRNDNDESQQWLIEDVGGGNVVLTNRHSGQVMELLGEDNGPPKDNGTSWNGFWVEQTNRHDDQRDQKWRFVKQ